MNRRVLMRVAAATGGLMLSATVGHAAELKVFTSVALTQALNELAPIFEQKTGNKLVIRLSTWLRCRRSASSTASGRTSSS